MPDIIDIQNVSNKKLPFSRTVLRSWATAALNIKNNTKKSFELTLRFVDTESILKLNHQYRNINKPTNVLAFPSETPNYLNLKQLFLGDVIICMPVLELEANQLKKSLLDHTAHIIIHGILHLLGYDHINNADTLIMQSLETDILNKLNIPDPYKNNSNNYNLDGDFHE